MLYNKRCMFQMLSKLEETPTKQSAFQTSTTKNSSREKYKKVSKIV